MSLAFEGVGASPGRVLGCVRLLEWEIPPVQHRTIGPDDVDREIERFERLLSLLGINKASVEAAGLELIDDLLAGRERLCRCGSGIVVEVGFGNS